MASSGQSAQNHLKNMFLNSKQFHNTMCLLSERDMSLPHVPLSPSLYKSWTSTESGHVSSAVICQPHNVSSAVFGQLGCSVPAQHMADCQLLCDFQAQRTCSAAIPWLNRNLSAQLHTVMDLQVCEPDLATASPSAIAGCTDKLEFCKVPMGAPAHTCVLGVCVCCCCHGFMFVATSEAWVSARLSAVTLDPAGAPIVIRLHDSSLSNNAPWENQSKHGAQMCRKAMQAHLGAWCLKLAAYSGCWPRNHVHKTSSVGAPLNHKPLHAMQRFNHCWIWPYRPCEWCTLKPQRMCPFPMQR